MNTHVRIAQHLSDLLDNRFKILGFHFGLDPIIGIIPWIGDFISLFFGFYIVWIATQSQLPQEKINQMIRNIMIDFVIGLVPFIGDIGDFFFKSNRMNWEILQRHLNKNVVEGELIR